jgi:uncharacterized repeat protein (TIGR01451 family)
MRIEDANSRWNAPRLLAIGAVALVMIVLGAVGSGGAGADPGDADLALTKSDSPDPVVAGNNLTYTIRVQNLSPLPATSVVVTDTLPSGVDFVSATGGNCQRSGRTVTCDLGQVDAGSTATVTIVVKTKKDGSLSNTASVASPEDIALANNSATVTSTVTKKAKKQKGTSCAAPTIAGTAGDDTITGTSRADAIVTFTGNDVVFAGGGKDVVCTDGGFDVVFGADGGDTIIGGGAADRLVGGKGGDVLRGKNGRDRLKGKSGDDVLNGGKKRDRCKGGSGADTLIRCP